MKTDWRIVEFGTGRVLVAHLAIADRYWPRLVGLQFRARPQTGFGLLLAPCPSIHTCFVRFAIDAVMLDRTGRVVDVRRGVRPWRVVMPRTSTFAFLELPVGGALEFQPGMIVRLDGPRDRIGTLRKDLRPWFEQA